MYICEDTCLIGAVEVGGLDHLEVYGQDLFPSNLLELLQNLDKCHHVQAPAHYQNKHSVLSLPREGSDSRRTMKECAALITGRW
jgi:hypothetical protein